MHVGGVVGWGLEVTKDFTCGDVSVWGAFGVCRIAAPLILFWFLDDIGFNGVQMNIAASACEVFKGINHHGMITSLEYVAVKVVAFVKGNGIA